jgi:hypothetical protein
MQVLAEKNARIEELECKNNSLSRDALELAQSIELLLGMSDDARLVEKMKLISGAIGSTIKERIALYSPKIPAMEAGSSIQQRKESREWT